MINVGKYTMHERYGTNLVALKVPETGFAIYLKQP